MLTQMLESSSAMNDAKWWLVCYDVHDPERLRKAAKILEGTGQRMQWSVFRCWMTPARCTPALGIDAGAGAGDEVLLIPLCPRAWRAWRRPTRAQNLRRPGRMRPSHAHQIA